jgi:FtsH-binding integral membrane protein
MSFGRYFSMAIIGLIVASVINIFLKSSGFNWVISIVTVVIFTGLTAYDTRKMILVSQQADGSDMFQKASIIGALELYLDFINIFLALLRIFGKSRD